MKVPLQGHVHVRISGSSFHFKPIWDVAASRVYVLVLTTVGHTSVSIIFPNIQCAIIYCMFHL